MSAPDVVKVIEGLEACMVGDGSSPSCEDCPYATAGDDTCQTMDDLFGDALALLRTMVPRLMTEEELREAAPDTVIWCEQRDGVRTYLAPLIKYDDGVFANRYFGAAPEAAQLPNIRFWTARPGDRQREATAWQE